MSDANETGTGKKRSHGPARTARKLPRSGLAEEILGEGELAGADLAPDTAPGTQPVPDEPPAPDLLANDPLAVDPVAGADSVAVEPVEVEPVLDAAGDSPGPLRQEAPVATPTGPGRIFAFADSLEDEAYTREREQARVELETWVSFELAGEVFALPVSHVQEILRVNTITPVPHAPQPVRGVTNKRGRVLPVVDLRRRLGLPAAEVGRCSRILVVESRARLLGLLVDAVQQVLRIERAAVQAPPADVMTAQSDYILGVYPLGEHLVILLDVDRVLVIKESARAIAG